VGVLVNSFGFGGDQFPSDMSAQCFAWEAEDNGSYIPDKTALLTSTALRNMYGAVEMRSEGSSVVNPAVTRSYAAGPLGPATAMRAVFSSTATSFAWLIVGTNSQKLEAGVSYEVEITAATLAGQGTKTYKLGQTTGTVGTDYGLVTVPEETTTTFTDPANVATRHRFTFVSDGAKLVGFWPNTSADFGELLIGSVRLRKTSDPAFAPLNEQRWGGWAARNTASAGGVPLTDGAFNLLGAGGAPSGLIAPYRTFPEPITFPGKTTLVLARMNGAPYTGGTSTLYSVDVDAGLSPAGAATQFSLTMDNSSQPGQFVPQPGYNVQRHGVNMLDLGFQVYWCSVDADYQEYGVDIIPFNDRVPTWAPIFTRLQRLGSSSTTRVITQLNLQSDMEIAAWIDVPRRLTVAERTSAVRKLKAAYAESGPSRTTGAISEVLNQVGDSNDVRAVGDHTYLINADGYFTPGPNLLTRNMATGGKGLYGAVLFSIDRTVNGNGFVDQMTRCMPTVAKTLEAGVAAGYGLRGFTNDADEVMSDAARVIADYRRELWEPMLATGADLIMMDMLDNSDRFPGPGGFAIVQYIWAQQALFAAENPGRVFYIPHGDFPPDIAALWDRAQQDTFFQLPDWVHLKLDPGDTTLARAYRLVVQAWRAYRGITV